MQIRKRIIQIKGLETNLKLENKNMNLNEEKSQKKTKIMKILTIMGTKAIQKYACQPEMIKINLNFDWTMT